MKPRIDYRKTAPDGISPLFALENYVRQSSLEPALLELVKLRASQINGCAYCIDMHTKDARAEGESERAAPLRGRCLARNAILHGTGERAALAWTEAVTQVSQEHVSDEVYGYAHQHFSEKELVDLTLAIIAINGWNRLAISFGSVAGTYQRATHRRTVTTVSRESESKRRKRRHQESVMADRSVNHGTAFPTSDAKREGADSDGGAFHA